VINLICRGVSLSAVNPSANVDIAYTLEAELKADPMVDPVGTKLQPQINVDETTGTFTFGIVLALKQPLKM
jgi:hypothetical protein